MKNRGGGQTSVTMKGWHEGDLYGDGTVLYLDCSDSSTHLHIRENDTEPYTYRNNLIFLVLILYYNYVR